MSEYTIPARDRHPRERCDASVASMAAIASVETGHERGGKGERCVQPRDILLVSFVSFVYLVCSVCGGRFGLSGLVNRLWANEARAELRHSPDNNE